MSIDAQAPGVNSAAVYGGFIADGKPGKFEQGLLGVSQPAIPPAMRELVRRGPPALPELVKHITDQRPTKFRVGNDLSKSSSSREVGMDFFAFSYFSDEYEPRILTYPTSSRQSPSTSRNERNFTGQYTVKVGDVCFVLIGQIVNRHLLAVRYQPSAGLVVNSPVESPELAKTVFGDWGRSDEELVKTTLLSDIRIDRRSLPVEYGSLAIAMGNSALQRLKLYFPETYKNLQGSDLRRKRELEKLRRRGEG